jgi:hypothetical protein
MSGLREYRDELYPSNEEDVNIKNLKMFFKFITERQLIWKRRFLDKLPREQWTKNDILKVTKYTNTYRQLDRGSLWCFHQILRPNWIWTDGGMENFQKLLWKLVIYRLCVRIETFEQIGLPARDNFDPLTYLKRFYDIILADNQPTCTNAFLTLGGLFKGISRPTGLIYAMMYMDNNMQDICWRIQNADTGYKIMKILCELPGISGFMAYEIYCDLCYCKDAIRFNINDAVNTGPGCVEGLRLLFPSTDCKRSATLPTLLQLLEDQDMWLDKFNIKFPYMNWLEPFKNKLSLRTLEHSLCEFSKYWLQYMSLKHGKKYGKNRLEYDRWKGGTNCVVAGNGRLLKYDDAVYEQFNYMSTFLMEPSSAYQRFCKKKDKTKEDYYNFIKNLQDKATG